MKNFIEGSLSYSKVSLRYPVPLGRGDSFFELFGVKWKAKLDSLKLEADENSSAFICDLKVMKNIREAKWVKDQGKTNFVDYWGYDLQATVYQKGVEIVHGKKLPFYIAAADKTEYPDIELIGINQEKLDACLIEIEHNIPRILGLKEGKLEPTRCDTCNYCKHTKVLTQPIPHDLLIQEI